MERLKSSFRNLQEAITSRKPIGPICIQESRTQSFGEPDLHSSFHYPPCTSSSSPSTSFGSSDPHYNSYQLPPCLEKKYFAFNESSATAAATTTTATTMSSSSPRGHIRSERFFFSPRTTKSIMEEAKPEIGTPKLPPTGEAMRAKASFCEESVTMAMSSQDPYNDFRASMEEMVAAHRLREWHSLQDLLYCYLRLNERENHKVIVLAFVDLVMHLMNQDKEALSEDSLNLRSRQH